MVPMTILPVAISNIVVGNHHDLHNIEDSFRTLLNRFDTTISSWNLFNYIVLP